MGGEAPQEAPEVEINVDNGTTEAPAEETEEKSEGSEGEDKESE